VTVPLSVEEMPLPEAILTIARTLQEAGFETWCVGGALRDWRLAPAQPLQHDVDLATAATPDEVRRLFRRTVAVGAKYGTVGVLDGNGVLHEVTTFRKDVATDGRHAIVEFGVSIEEDLHRRDFTINAMAYHPLTHRWLDPEGGRQDLERGVVRAVGAPDRRFAEDYLRILRMLRFAARFGFTIDPATFAAARTAAVGLAHLSAERVREEWFKGLLTARSRKHFVALWGEVGAADILLPGLRTPYPLAEPHPALPADPVILTAALCQRSGDVLRRLRASGSEISRADAMERGPAEPSGSDPVAVRRWLASVRGAADDLLQLAELRSGAPPAWGVSVRDIRARGEATSRGQLALSGDDLRAAGVAPGPELGQLLGRLLEAVLEDPGLNTRDQLLQLVRSWR
jgi:tRNA nucleotidyltransferase (CCA-adding enzyme)